MESEIYRLKAENDHLRKLLGVVDSQPDAVSLTQTDGTKSAVPTSGLDNPAACSTCPPRKHTWEASSHDLSREQVLRYSRQLILPAFGPAGKLPSITITQLLYLARRSVETVHA